MNNKEIVKLAKKYDTNHKKYNKRIKKDFGIKIYDAITLTGVVKIITNVLEMKKK